MHCQMLYNLQIKIHKVDHLPSVVGIESSDMTLAITAWGWTFAV